MHRRDGRMIYILIWLAVFGVSIWLCSREGRYTHYVEVTARPNEEEFSASLSVSGWHVRAGAEDMRLEMEKDRQEYGWDIEITGNAEEYQRKDEIVFCLASEDEFPVDDWKVTGAQGLGPVRYRVRTEENREGFWYPLLVMLLGGLMAIGTLAAGVLLPRHGREKQAAHRMLEKMQREPWGKDGLEAGEKWFLECRRRRRLYWGILEILFFCPLLLYGWKNVHRFDWEMSDLPLVGGIALCLMPAVIFEVLLLMRWEKDFFGILFRENRPLTCAAACFVEAAYGDSHGSWLYATFYNGADGLCRSGRYRDALDMADICFSSARSNLWKFYVCDLRLTCFKKLGMMQEMQAEEELRNKLLRRLPSLKWNTAFQMKRLLLNAQEEAERGRAEEAEAYLERYLSRAKNDYFRLRAYGVQACIWRKNGEERKAEEAEKRILQFSPENVEVREAMAYGTCMYREPDRLYRGTYGGCLMAASLGLSILALTVVAALCIWGSASAGELVDRPFRGTALGQWSEFLEEMPEKEEDISGRNRDVSGDRTETEGLEE